MSANEPVSVHVLDREYTVGVAPDERASLMAAAKLLDLATQLLDLRLARQRALLRLATHVTRFDKLIFTVFLAPDAQASLGPVRQPDGVVTHDIRPPYHLLAEDVHHLAAQAGLAVEIRPNRLPRGQVLCVAQRR